MINRIAGYSERSKSAGDPGTANRPWLPQNLNQVMEPVGGLIVNYPEAALAAAFIVGVALAWWIKRR
jgi:hypothetical protein